jgi:proteasome lid subunit RPN8/RPN11
MVFNMVPESISIHKEHWQEMLTYVLDSLPEEACGLLGGKGERVLLVLPIDNIAKSPVSFRMDPRQQVEGLMHLESEDLELVGIYHSHPCGPTSPSDSDVEEAAYTEAAFLIWSKSDVEWQCNAFALLPGEAREIPIHTEE